MEGNGLNPIPTGLFVVCTVELLYVVEILDPITFFLFYIYIYKK